MPLLRDALGGQGVDADVAALIRRMTLAPVPGRRAAMSRFVRALKRTGVWDKMDVLYVFAAHDAQAARLNWKGNSAYDATAVNSPTFTVDQGYAGDGATSYLNTGWAPSAGVNYLQDSATVFGWSRTAAAEAGTGNYWIGTATSADVRVTPRTSADVYAYRINQATSSGPANTDGSGLFAVSRSGAAATQSYRNGAAIGSAGNVASAARSAVAINIGRGNSTFSPAQCAAMGAGANLNSTEHAALYTALNTYLTAVGAA